jgi:MFS family permease
MGSGNAEAVRMDAEPARAPDGPPGRGLEHWCALGVVLAPGLLLGMPITLVVPVLPSVAQHFGGGEGAKLIAEYVMAMSGAGIMLGAPVGGMAVDRLGYRAVLLPSLALFVLSGMAGAFVDQAAPMLLARFGLGFGAGAFVAAATALLGARWQGPARARLLGLLTALGSITSLFAILGAGQLADRFGWRTPFLLYGVVAPVALLCLFVKSDKPATTAADQVGKAQLADWRPLLPLFLAALPLFVVMFAPTSQLPLVLGDIGAGAKERSFILGGMTVFTALSALTYAPLTGRLGARRMLVLIVALFAVGVTAMGAAQNMALATAGVLICGVGVGLMPAHFNHGVLDEAPAQIRGRAASVMIALNYLAQFLNPVLIGSLGAMIGIQPALLVTGGLLFLWLIATTPGALRPRPA